MAPSFADIPWLPKDTWLSFWTGCSFNFVLRSFFTCFCTRGILFTFSRGCFCVPMHGRQAKLIKKVSSVCLSRWLRWVSRNVEFLGEVAKHRLVCNCRKDYCVAVMCLLRKYRTYIRRWSWMPAWCVELSYHARIPNRVQCRLFVAHSQKHVWSCSLRWYHFDAFRCHEWCAFKQCRKGSWEHVCLCECRSQKSIYSMQWLLHCVLSRRYVQFWIVMNSIYIPTSVRAMLG